ncbi:SSBP3 protein, partial [Chaetops frenatus]|nr:SSBP3 protein [Chaetops frenatus]
QPFMSPRYPGGPRPPLRIPNQALGGVPGSQPLLPSGMDPTRQQGHPNMGGPMQRMTPPRGMVPLGPQVFSTDVLSDRPVLSLGPGGGRPWPNPTNANSIPYSSASPGNYVVSTLCVFVGHHISFRQRTAAQMCRGASGWWLGAEHLACTTDVFQPALVQMLGAHHQNHCQPAPNCPQ